ncbi:hypothetical protein QBC45DRAFT_396202 [Copromyces sp. CBS 386.78]|nr:hypothetical protein QBC45DRAFT_396202 [Copromyces sp. CBS 386.78]
MPSEFSYGDSEREYDELWDGIRKSGPSSPSLPVIQPVQPVPERPSVSIRGSIHWRSYSSAYYSREHNPFDNEFRHALCKNSGQTYEAPASILTPEFHVSPAGIPPAAQVAIPAARVPPPLLPDATPAATSQRRNRGNAIYNGRIRPGVFRFPSSYPSSPAFCSKASPPNELSGSSSASGAATRDILTPNDEDQDPQPNANSDEAFGSGSLSWAEETDNNSSPGNGGVTSTIRRRILTPPNCSEFRDELRFPSYGC